MLIYRSLEEVKPARKTVIALGNFDGIHIAHQKILTRAVQDARQFHALSVCFTFSNHTRNGVRRICSENEKLCLLQELGFDIVFNPVFDNKIKSLSPQGFIQTILHDRLKALEVCCGFNYRFGAGAAGDVTYLKNACDVLGIRVFVQEAVMMEGQVVSSTEIRKLIQVRNFDYVKRLLGRELIQTAR